MGLGIQFKKEKKKKEEKKEKKGKWVSLFGIKKIGAIE